MTETTDEKAAAGPRLVAMKYIEDLRTGMTASSPRRRCNS